MTFVRLFCSHLFNKKKIWKIKIRSGLLASTSAKSRTLRLICSLGNSTVRYLAFTARRHFRLLLELRNFRSRKASPTWTCFLPSLPSFATSRFSVYAVAYRWCYFNPFYHILLAFCTPPFLLLNIKCMMMPSKTKPKIMSIRQVPDFRKYFMCKTKT